MAKSSSPNSMWSGSQVYASPADEGSRDNPFGRWNAEHDYDLPSYYVDLDEFDLLQRLTEPCVVFARRGCGKTAQRQMLAAQYRPLDPSSRWLAVPYTYAGFEPALQAVDYNVRRVQARHHVEAILRQGLAALDREAQRDTEIARDLAAPAPAAQWAAYVARFAAHLLPAIDPGDVRPLDALSSPELLAGFVGLIRAAGLDTCAILVDGLDEFPQTAGDPKRAVRFLAPLLSTLSLIEQPGLAFKFFLPHRMETDLVARGWLRQDRVRLFRITWTMQQINEMLSQRMMHYGGHEAHFQELAQLCDGELAPKIKNELARLAEGSPRTALMLANELLRAHYRRASPPDLIARETWEQVKEAWLAEHGGPAEVRFPVLRVDVDRQTVHLDDLDITAELSSQVYLVLKCLYIHKGEVCTKDVLGAEAWEKGWAAGDAASDEMLAQSIRRLRRTLEKYEPEVEYVETIRGRGYRLHPGGKPRE